MPWWSWRPGQPGGGELDTRSRTTLESAIRVGPPAPREPDHDCTAAGRTGCVASGRTDCVATGRSDRATVSVSDPTAAVVAPLTINRVGRALDRLEMSYLADGEASLLALWQRHALMFTLEGPEDEILVMRARPHSTVPPDWADRAYRVVNEWNHTERYCKAYVGDPTGHGQLPIYIELQVPFRSGTHDALLVEVVENAARAATAFVDWLHDEGALL
ncbi:YbjN domain-containing protein [Plantactinospora sp. GCM10030261]|uniref:YbjN domain-containing protein n=1 Tax=Plantactinospora sp. GCM10030261 TaxID=3273420 RepID=UPI0036080C76